MVVAIISRTATLEKGLAVSGDLSFFNNKILIFKSFY